MFGGGQTNTRRLPLTEKSSSGSLLDHDASCLAGVQKGLHSHGMKGFWMSHPERRIRNFHHWWEKYMGI